MVKLVGNIIDLLFNPWLLRPIFELINTYKTEGITANDILERFGSPQDKYKTDSSHSGVNTIMDTIKFLSIIGLIKRKKSGYYVVNHKYIPNWYYDYFFELNDPFKLLVLHAIKKVSKEEGLKKEEAILWVFEWIMEKLTKEDERKEYSWFIAQDTEQINSFNDWLRKRGYSLEWNPNKALHWIDFGSWIGFCGNHIKLNKQNVTNIIFSENLLFDLILLYFYQNDMHITKTKLLPISNFLVWVDLNFINLPEATRNRRRIPLNLVNAFYRLESKKKIRLITTGDSINFIFESRLYEGKGFEANQMEIIMGGSYNE